MFEKFPGRGYRFGLVFVFSGPLPPVVLPVVAQGDLTFVPSLLPVSGPACWRIVALTLLFQLTVSVIAILLLLKSKAQSTTARVKDQPEVSTRSAHC
jgi:hypothetical protein